MKFTIAASLLSLASAVSAAAIPADGPTGFRQGPLSFIAQSDNAAFNGKWLAPGRATVAGNIAILSAQRYRNFFITDNSELEYTDNKKVTRTARINDTLKIFPLLAQVSFDVHPKKDTFLTSEKTFKINDQGNIEVRNGKPWYACTEASGEITVKVLAVGTEPLGDNCSKITLESVDGIAK